MTARAPQSPTTLDDQSTRVGARTVFTLAALVAAVLDALLVLWLQTKAIGPAAFATFHLALATVAGVGSARILPDRTHAVFLWLGIAVMGPFGALGAALVALADRTSPNRRAELETWHRTLSGHGDESRARMLHDDIVEGRAYRPSETSENFGSLLANGSVPERQAVLGLLVQNDERDAVELMTSALRSRDVAVRASAAAAVARMRETATARSHSTEGRR